MLAACRELNRERKTEDEAEGRQHSMMQAYSRGQPKQHGVKEHNLMEKYYFP